MLLDFDMPYIDTGIDTPPERAISVIMLFYVIAASSTASSRTPASTIGWSNRNPLYPDREFAHCVSLLWRDKLGQVSLATTTLFWGAGATLQFIVIDWAARSARLDLSQASMLQGVVAVGIALGAVHRRALVSLRGAVKVLPIGIAMGLIVIAMIFVHALPLAMCLMIAIGACAGFFVVPMNALLQHRGHVLMGAGPLDRRAEFQREHRHSADGRALRLMVSSGCASRPRSCCSACSSRDRWRS
jgi:hypothetical protein